jgi:hypothetical protein
VWINHVFDNAFPAQWPAAQAMSFSGYTYNYYLRVQNQP